MTTPFELVHNCKPDSKTCFELFSVGYFGHDKDDGELRSKTQNQTLDGIAVGRDDKSNTIVFYNPIHKTYYRPPNFKLDEGRLPIANFPKSISFDGGLTCGLLRNRTDPVPEPFPPGTRVSLTIDGKVVQGTINNIPLSSVSGIESVVTPPITMPDPEDLPAMYTVLLDDGTTKDLTYEDLILDDRTKSNPESSTDQAVPNPAAGLPALFRPGSKVTMDYNGAFHKGYITLSPEGGFTFAVRRTARSTKIDWQVPLPNLSSHKQPWWARIFSSLVT